LKGLALNTYIIIKILRIGKIDWLEIGKLFKNTKVNPKRIFLAEITAK